MALPPRGTLTGDLGNALGGSPSGAGTLWLTPPTVVAYAEQGYTLLPQPIAVPVAADGTITATAVARTDLGNPAGWAYVARADVPGLPETPFAVTVVSSSQDIAAGIVSKPGSPEWLPTTTPHAHDNLYPSRTEVNNLIAGITGVDVSGVVKRMGGLSETSSVDDLADGVFTVSTSTVADALGMPASAGGLLKVWRYGALDYVVQEYTTHEVSPRIFVRTKTSTTWRPWSQVAPSPLTGLTDQSRVDDLPTGSSYVGSSARAATLGLPAQITGVIETWRFGALDYVVQRFTTSEPAARIFVRTKTSTWRPWSQVAPTPHTETATGSGPGASGVKVVPLSVTTGQGDASLPAVASGSWRVPLHWTGTITRWRLHVAAINPRTGTVQGDPQLTGIWLGKHLGNGAASGLVQISTGVTLPTDGTDWVSGWRTEPISGDEMLLTFGMTSTTAPILNLGASWTSTATGDASVTFPSGLAATTSTPLSWWIEAETPSTTPVVGAFGDSLSCGVGTSRRLLDSVVSVYARDRGGLPVHYAHSGDNLTSWWQAGKESHKLRRWDAYARPDAVLWAMGSNDLFGLALPAATVQQRFNDLLPWVREHMSPVIHLATIPPRTRVTGDQETQRRAYNTWLATKVVDGTARDLYGFAAAVSADDEALNAEHDADGVHLTEAGYLAQVAAIVRPLTGSAQQQVVITDPGGTDSITSDDITTAAGVN